MSISYIYRLVLVKDISSRRGRTAGEHMMADPVMGSAPRGNCCNATKARLRVKGRGKKIMHTKEQLLEENTSSSPRLYTLLYYTVPSSSSSEPPASNIVQLIL